ncbi:MAG: hypothetical protein ACYS47_02950 [Planctomycetota bacterium]|jgi:hypothetical protein
MNILEKIRNLFSGGGGIPEEARSVIEKARSTRELLSGLDAVLTRNEMAFNKLKREIDKVVAILDEEEGKVQEGDLKGRQKRYTLQYVKRLRSHLDNLDHRMTIYDKNINLHIQLIGKIQDMEAMALRGVDEKQIDKIIMEFEEQVGEYMEVVHAGEAGFEGATSIAEREDKQLAALEKELLAEKKPKEEAELAVIEPIEEEKAEEEEPPAEAEAEAPGPAEEEEEEEEDEAMYE